MFKVMISDNIMGYGEEVTFEFSYKEDGLVSLPCLCKRLYLFQEAQVCHFFPSFVGG